MENKIACFGVPSVFSFKSKVCGSCKDFTECQDSSYKALLAIREYPIATTMLNQHEKYRIAQGLISSGVGSVNTNLPIPSQQKGKITRYALTQEQISRISELPKKIGNFLEKIWVRGLDKQIAKDIEMGKNPFSMDNARPYHVAFEEIKNKRMHRSAMSDALMNKLGWTYASAYSQVSMIWQIFPELGVAKVDGLFLRAVHPNDIQHNNEKLDRGNYEY